MFPLLLAAAVTVLPVGAIAIKRMAQKTPSTGYYDEDNDRLVVNVGRYPTQPKTDPLKALMIGTAIYLVAKKAKVV